MPVPVTTNHASSAASARSGAESLVRATRNLQDLSSELNTSMEQLAAYKKTLLTAESQQLELTKRYEQHMKEASAARKKLAALVADPKSSPDTVKVAKRALGELAVLDKDFRQIENCKPSTGSLFVRLWLGRINVRSVLQRDRDVLRREYDKFKYRTNFVFLLLPALWLAISYKLGPFAAITHTQWIPTLSHVWLTYYYVSLALRENTLRANGSKIMNWWVYHHYISAFMSVVALTWPDTVVNRLTMPKFGIYFTYQAVVLVVQSAYQRRRHYTLRALGKASRADPATSEGLSENHTGLWGLAVLLFGAYAFQAYMAYYLAATAVRHLDFTPQWWTWREEVQVTSLSVCFLILAVCNSAALITTLARKRKRLKRHTLQLAVDAQGESEPALAEMSEELVEAAKSVATVRRRRAASMESTGPVFTRASSS